MIEFSTYSPDDKICGYRIGDVIEHIKYCEKNGIDITSFNDGVRYGLEKANEIAVKQLNKFMERSNDV